MSFSLLRKRKQPDTVVGGNPRGSFLPFGSPTPYVFGDVNPLTNAGQSVYQYHEGDLFTPGAMNFVFETKFESNPVQTIWGFAFLRKPNTFAPRQPPPLIANHSVVQNGIGGEQFMPMELQPLVSPTGEHGGA